MLVLSTCSTQKQTQVTSNKDSSKVTSEYVHVRQINIYQRCPDYLRIVHGIGVCMPLEILAVAKVSGVIVSEWITHFYLYYLRGRLGESFPSIILCAAASLFCYCRQFEDQNLW